jgi:hypothetical protein
MENNSNQSNALLIDFYKLYLQFYYFFLLMTIFLKSLQKFLTVFLSPLFFYYYYFMLFFNLLIFNWVILQVKLFNNMNFFIFNILDNLYFLNLGQLMILNILMLHCF